MGVVVTVLRRLFPTFDIEAVGAGLAIGAGELAPHFDGHCFLRPKGRVPDSIMSSRMGYATLLIETCLISRSHRRLEALVRRLVQKGYPSVRFVRGSVQNLLPSPDGTRVSAAQVQMASGMSEIIPLALFVDCTGPACAAVRWLPQASPAWSAPTRETYEPHMAYSNVTIPLTSQVQAHLERYMGRPLHAVEFLRFVNPSWWTTEHRQYGVGRLEGNQRKRESVYLTCALANYLSLLVLLGVCQWAGRPDALPKTLAEFYEWCLSIERTVSLDPLPHALFDAISAIQATYEEAGTEPEWSTHRVRGGLYNLRYDQCEKGALPVNFVALGDAAMRVNPIFGQGIGKAAIDVATLDGVLRRIGASSAGIVHTNVTVEFFKQHIRRTQPMFDQTRMIGVFCRHFLS
jgi:hypothetical protein